MAITWIRESAVATRIDWAVALLLPVLAIRVYSSAAALAGLVVLIFVIFTRHTDVRRSMLPGPLVVFVAAVGIVLSRPESTASAVFFVMVTILVVQLVLTVDARILITSFIDGAGIYLLLNVLGFLAGLQSPNAGDRVGAYVESGGFVRIIFPLSSSLEVAPTVASVYLASVVFLIMEEGGRRRIFRIVCFVAAVAVSSQGADRTGLFAGIVLPVLVFFIPSITRWVAQVTTLFASVSATVLPFVVPKLNYVLIPFLSFIAPNRDTHVANVNSLSNRAEIWSDSLDYWTNYVEGSFDRLIGFGQDGQYRSGASMVYARALAGTVKHPEHASMHNSFLQQLFDGGLVGWLLLVLAMFWTSVRLSRRVRVWGAQGMAAVVAVAALLINSMTQVSISPGYVNETFWLVVVLVGVACQVPRVAESADGRSGEIERVHQRDAGESW